MGTQFQRLKAELLRTSKVGAARRVAAAPKRAAVKRTRRAASRKRPARKTGSK
jgi:hypothetical protein